MRKCYGALDSKGRTLLESRLMRYLLTWPEGLSSARMHAWVDSCTKGGGYTYSECQTAITELRDSGRIAIANGVWYLRSTIKKEQ